MDRPNRLFFFFSLQKHLEGEDDFVLASFFSSRALLDLELRGPSTSLTTMAWTLSGNQLSYWVRPLYWASFTLVNISNVGVPAANSSLTAFCRSLNQTLFIWTEYLVHVFLKENSKGHVCHPQLWVWRVF